MAKSISRNLEKCFKTNSHILIIANRNPNLATFFPNYRNLKIHYRKMGSNYQRACTTRKPKKAILSKIQFCKSQYKKNRNFFTLKHKIISGKPSQTAQPFH